MPTPFLRVHHLGVLMGGFWAMPGSVTISSREAVRSSISTACARIASLRFSSGSDSHAARAEDLEEPTCRARFQARYVDCGLSKGGRCWRFRRGFRY